MHKLYADFNGRVEVGQILAELDPALFQAQLKRDRTNFDSSVIRLPISGVVVAHNVNMGQTVAAPLIYAGFNRCWWAASAS